MYIAGIYLGIKKCFISNYNVFISNDKIKAETENNKWDFNRDIYLNITDVPLKKSFIQRNYILERSFQGVSK